MSEVVPRRCSAKKLSWRFRRIYRMQKYFCQSLMLQAFRMSNCLKRDSAQVFSCEFFEIFKNRFLTEHHRMTASCVYLLMLKRFSEYLFHRTPLGNYLFHVQVAGFWPVYTLIISQVLFKYFVQEREVAFGRCPFNQNP